MDNCSKSEDVRWGGEVAIDTTPAAGPVLFDIVFNVRYERLRLWRGY
jgi:hypothetical protein